MRREIAVVFVAMSLSGNRAVGQATTVETADTCTYRLCALTIVPTWNGLRVVRGASSATVTNLNFFFPRDISHALQGDGRLSVGSDSVTVAAHRALRLRRIGAVFTDAGLIGIAVAGARAAGGGSNKRTNGIIAGTGFAMLGIAVPFQFAADGALSKAIWWYNWRYSESSHRSQ